jgi:hypothetical protein
MQKKMFLRRQEVATITVSKILLIGARSIRWTLCDHNFVAYQFSAITNSPLFIGFNFVMNRYRVAEVRVASCIELVDWQAVL